MLKAARSLLLVFAAAHIAVAQPDSVRAIEVRPGITIQDFSIAYPDIAPKRLSFSGHLKVDSVWHGHLWHMDFTFGGDALSGAFWYSDPISPESMPDLFRRAREEFQPLYGNTYLDEPATDSTWIQPHIWRLKNTEITLQQTADSLLELRLNSLTRSVDGFYGIDVPMLYAMPIGTFGVFHPHVVAQGVGYQGLVEQPGILGGFRGKWQYWFKNDVLERMAFKSIFQARVAQDSMRFAQVSNFYRALVESQAQLHGKPEFAQKEGDTTIVLRDSKRLRSTQWNIEDPGKAPISLTIDLIEYGPSDGFGYFMQVTYALLPEPQAATPR